MLIVSAFAVLTHVEAKSRAATTAITETRSRFLSADSFSSSSQPMALIEAYPVR
jgi:hypothetical protein